MLSVACLLLLAACGGSSYNYEKMATLLSQAQGGDNSQELYSKIIDQYGDGLKYIRAQVDKIDACQTAEEYNKYCEENKDELQKNCDQMEEAAVFIKNVALDEENKRKMIELDNDAHLLTKRLMDVLVSKEAMVRKADIDAFRKLGEEQPEAPGEKEAAERAAKHREDAERLLSQPDHTAAPAEAAE